MPLKLGPFFLGEPTQRDVDEVARASPSLPFNFPHVGITEQEPPLKGDVAREWWAVQRRRVRVGTGRDDFGAARDAVSTWRQFDLGWAHVPNKPPAKRGAAVVVAARSLVLWSLNPLRVTKAGEAERPPGAGAGRRYRLAHATLAGHQISGEERFAVDWDRADDSVWYEVYSVSRPATPLATLAYPLLRFYQARFARQSGDAVARGVAAARQRRQRR